MKNYIPLVVPLYNLSEQTPRSVPSFSYTRNIYLLKKTETICSIHQQTSYPLSKTLSSCRDKCLFRTRSDAFYGEKDRVQNSWLFKGREKDESAEWRRMHNSFSSLVAKNVPPSFFSSSTSSRCGTSGTTTTIFITWVKNTDDDPIVKFLIDPIFASILASYNL